MIGQGHCGYSKRFVALEHAPHSIENPRYNSHKRRNQWLSARLLRQELRPIALQTEVAAKLGITRQAVEQIELRALAKIISAFQEELACIKTT